MTHQCPAPGCTLEVRTEMLMCRAHWYAVPKAVRNAVWAAWDNGAGSGTSQHRAAITAAIRSVNP